MSDTLKTLKSLRQSRQFDGHSIPVEDVQTILEIARWTGSARNIQPWQLIVVQEKAALQALAEVRDLNSWVADAGCVIAIALPSAGGLGAEYDEGRLSERIMLAATTLGLGSGTAWFVDDEQRAQARDLLDLPEDLSVKSLVVLGYVDQPSLAGSAKIRGRKPLDEIVSWERYGNR
ncbi:MAG: nitroreductase family protein [Thermomicrobiales bacterium]|nr:nitroreductase family protein [Thermomicrobiales bacterium]